MGGYHFFPPWGEIWGISVIIALPRTHVHPVHSQHENHLDTNPIGICQLMFEGPKNVPDFYHLVKDYGKSEKYVATNNAISLSLDSHSNMEHLYIIHQLFISY